MKNILPPPKSSLGGFGAPLLLLAVITLLFIRSFNSDLVHFSNDGPLGQINAAWRELPAAFSGSWYDINDLGSPVGAIPPSITTLIYLLFGAVSYSKFYAAISLLILGLGALLFFRALRLTPLAATLGALAACLNSAYLGNACWGVASGEIAIGCNLLALALVLNNSQEPRRLVRWIRLVLAGFCVGMNVMEAADIGALWSVMVAAFVFFHSLLENKDALATKILRGVGRVAVIAVFAGLLAAQTIAGLVSTQIQGVAGTEQDKQSKLERWDWATQWSKPKLETFSLFIPGLFGYKMDTPKDMAPGLQSFYSSGVYWGGMGRSPELDRWLDNGAQGEQPQGFMRFTGGGDYCGILVCLLAFWALAQGLRRKDSVFDESERKIVLFWAAVLLICLPIAWGRFAPWFYGALYQLPYFSTIRNPVKFIIFVCWALVVLFAYAVHGLDRKYLSTSVTAAVGPFEQVKIWWARATAFDRSWTRASLFFLAACAVGWFIYVSQKGSLIAYLARMGYPSMDPAYEVSAPAVAAFSIAQVKWFVVLLAIAVGLVILIMSGFFAGRRARWGGIFLGAFLVFDLGRAAMPYIVHWDYKQKYEVGSLNPIVEKLREKPYEQRVAGLPFRAPEGMELLDQVYRIEWMQHHFPYYNIQCLDIIQMPRMPADLKMYLEAFAMRGTEESARLMVRRWELANNRWLLGAAGYIEAMNSQLDPQLKRFRIAERFEIVPKPGVLQPQRLEELTAVANPNGRYALFEFTGALPRVKLYSQWQANTNDQAVLKTLTDLNFNPAETVLVSTPPEKFPLPTTNATAGEVKFKSYTPKHIILDAQVAAPAVLLLNDKFDPNWRVMVNGQPAQLLRCNFLMRGVALPPGSHTVEFYFSLPSRPMQITSAAFGVGIILCLALFFLTRKSSRN